MSEEVRLRHYDLSNGMARQMSPMLLGRLIETIPHTAVAVFGLEWFYGGGIQSLPSQQVVAVYGFEPVEVITLGRTSKTKQELLRFLEPLRAKYAPERYDLFHNNCNHFSNEVVQFLLSGTSVPDKIMRVPQDVLSTPFGGMLAGMINANNPMQSRFGAPGTAALDPFRALAGPAPAPAPAASSSAAPGATAAAATGSSPASSAFTSLDAIAAAPLLSADHGNVAAAVARLLAAHGSLPPDSPHRLSADDVLALEAAPALLAAAAADAVVGAAGAGGGGGADSGAPDSGSLTRWGRLAGIASLALREWPRLSAAVPALALLRVLVLHPEAAPSLFPTAAPSTGAAVAGEEGRSSSYSGGRRADSVLWDLLEALHAAATAGATAASNSATGAAQEPWQWVWGSAAADALALSTLLNAFGTRAGAAWAGSPSVLPRLADIVTLRFAAPAAQAADPATRPCRALAASLAANIARGGGSTTAAAAGSAPPAPMSEVDVQLLLGLLQALPGEPSAGVAAGMLRAAGALLRRVGDEAPALVVTLSLDDHVRTRAGLGVGNSSAGGCAFASGEGSIETAELGAVAGEVLALLDKAVAAAASA